MCAEESASDDTYDDRCEWKSANRAVNLKRQRIQLVSEEPPVSFRRACPRLRLSVCSAYHSTGAGAGKLVRQDIAELELAIWEESPSEQSAWTSLFETLYMP